MKKYNQHIGSILRHHLNKTIELDSYKTSTELKDLLEARDPISVVAGSSVFASIVIHAHIIICIAINGKIPTRLSQCRPTCPILAVCKCRKLARILTIFNNVLPTVCNEKLNKFNYKDQIQLQLKHGIAVAKQLKLVSFGDLVIYCYDTFENSDEEVMTYQTSYLSEELIKN